MRSFLSMVVLATLCGCQGPEGFARRWVYAPPDRGTGSNIAALACPVPDGSGNRVLPQLGDISFTRVGASKLEGKTDQGCTWQFVVNGNTAELSPPGQSCHNRVFDTDYSIDRWVLTQDESGLKATEVLTATSHQPNMECAFLLEKGSRVAVGETPSDHAYLGEWRYGAPDPRVGTNLAMVTCPGEKPAFEPVSGTVVFSTLGQDHIRAEVDGCGWTLDVHAGAARLSPATQTCTRADGTRETRTYWAIASDGARQTEILRAEKNGCATVVADGERAR
jgi:hypothetical protein